VFLTDTNQYQQTFSV